MDIPATKHPASFRDPSGYIFTHQGLLYRQVNRCFAGPFDKLMKEGCYQQLTDKQWLIPHTTVAENLTGDPEWYATLRPERVPFVSYPYEWSFDMLKDAALLTLRILKTSLDFGLILKDASAYNILFRNGKPVFIDTLSFDIYREEEPWVAYRQFCEHFLGPLLLMHYRKLPLHPLLLAWPDGIPLSITRALLPVKSRFSLHCWLHIHLHAKVSARPKPSTAPTISFSRKKLINLVNSLEILLGRLRLNAAPSHWSGYYEEAAERENYLAEKQKIFTRWLGTLTGIREAVDLGANDGLFSSMIAATGIPVVAADGDPLCINRLYRQLREETAPKAPVYPLIADLANPSPALGANHEERTALLPRLASDLVTALALVHHLAIGRNMPWPLIAALFGRVCRKQLIIEFVPRQDPKVIQMLAGRKDIFTSYDPESFEAAFGAYFAIQQKEPIGDSGRVLYLMNRHAN